MKWATSRLSKNRKLFTVLAGLVIPLLLFALQIDQKSFIAKLIQEGFYSPFWSISNKLSTLIDVYKENVALKSENVRLKFDMMVDAQKRKEDDRFREMLRLLPRAEYRIIPADVIAHDQGRRWTSMIIRGTEELDRFLPVVDENGLVGKISSSTGTVATASLLVGPNCRVAARDNQTRTLGIVKWYSGSGLYFDDVAIEHDVNVGDTIISSGMGGVFPEGLMIGSVAKVDTIPTSFFKAVRVKPFANFGSLDNVMVLKPVAGSFGN
jgi:rod shape-determining protein MreC